MAVAGKAFAGYAGKAGHASIRDLPEVLALVHGGDVDLDSGDAHGFECIEYADARVRIRSRIDDDAVHRVIRILNPVDDRALMVRLKDLYIVESKLDAGLLAYANEVVIGFMTIDVWLAYADHVDIRSIDDKCVHEAPSSGDKMNRVRFIKVVQ